jgi:hypothetical protein
MEAAKGTKEEGELRAAPFSTNTTDDLNLMMILFLREYKQQKSRKNKSRTFSAASGYKKGETSALFFSSFVFFAPSR